MMINICKNINANSNNSQYHISKKRLGIKIFFENKRAEIYSEVC